MTLGIGNRLAKLKQTWNQETGKTETVDPPELVEGEMFREFEVVAIGSQGEEPFIVVLKKVK